MGVVPAKERPNRGGENLLQVMKILKVGVIHNLSAVVVNEKVTEGIEVRESGKGRQKSHQQAIGPEY
jgi:hypothetical protein